MKRFLLKLAAFALALVLPCVAYAAYILRLPNMYEGSLMGAAAMKSQILASAASPKLVIIGGSNTPYAFDSGRLETALGMPVCNMGTTAYLGIPFLLKQAENELEPGDIAVLAFEFSAYEGVVNYRTVWCALENHAALYGAVPLSYWPGLIGSFHLYASDKLSLLKSPGADGLDYAAHYAQGGFDKYGDYWSPRENILEHGYNTEDCRAVDENTITDENLATLRDFTERMTRRGVDVYFTYAPFNRLALTNGTDGVRALQARITESCGAQWLGDLEEGVMDERYFFNSNNHLNTEGAALRTEALLAALWAREDA